MKTNLDMGNFKIHNVKNDDNNDGVVNKGYVDQAYKNLNQMISLLNTDKLSNPSEVDLNMTNNNFDNNITKSEEKIKKYVDESHITSSTNFKDEFRYLMEDIDESSSEINIVVTGITDLAESPHTFNKKAYDLFKKKNEK